MIHACLVHNDTAVFESNLFLPWLVFSSTWKLIPIALIILHLKIETIFSFRLRKQRNKYFAIIYHLEIQKKQINGNSKPNEIRKIRKIQPCGGYTEHGPISDPIAWQRMVAFIVKWIFHDSCAAKLRGRAKVPRAHTNDRLDKPARIQLSATNHSVHVHRKFEPLQRPTHIGSAMPIDIHFRMKTKRKKKWKTS